MANSKSKQLVQLGEGLPTLDVQSEFYKDIQTDKLYQKLNGEWIEKTIFPSTKFYT